MANHNVTTLVRALTTPRGRHLRRVPPGHGGEPSPASPRVRDCFTDTELSAAQQLVLLSESSSEDVALQAASRSSSASSSSFPSVTNAALPQRPAADAPVEDDEEEGISGVPGIRRRRYRSIRGLYEATSPIGGSGEARGALQCAKKKSS
ncbi:hypothetical protein Taro_030398 [Colocasia esculenta]|uniref:Uncharacterized protein n=1 Tax=Colocasia esculenta TaxID=4460 RepID=A0A843VXS2_COLES|nr:hypothetical protein [Colocasia esculenta]